MAGLRDHLHFRPDIFANASRVAHIIQQRAAASNKNGGGGGGGKVWAAVHDRTGDFQAQFGDTFFVQPAALKDHLTQVSAALFLGVLLSKPSWPFVVLPQVPNDYKACSRSSFCGEGGQDRCGSTHAGSSGKAAVEFSRM